MNFDDINKPLQSLIEKQQDTHLRVLTKLINRLRLIGELPLSELDKLENALFIGEDVADMMRELEWLAHVMAIEIDNILYSVAEKMYYDAEPMYANTDTPFLPFSQKTELHKELNSFTKAFGMSILGMLTYKALMVQDINNPQIFYPVPIDTAYKDFILQAVAMRRLGQEYYDAFVNKTIRNLADSEVRSLWVSQDGELINRRSDSIVHTMVLHGTTTVAQTTQDFIGSEIKADGIELSAHVHPAPDHSMAQGRTFSNPEYEKLNNNEMAQDWKGTHVQGFVRKIGAWNCRHLAFAVILDNHIPRYDDEELKEILAHNEQGFVDTDGKHFTLYEATQKQRAMELKIRQYKNRAFFYKRYGNQEEEEKSSALAKKWTKDYIAFSMRAGLDYQAYRLNK